MKKVLCATLITLIIAILTFLQVKAQSIDDNDWTSNISCQNQSEIDDANVELVFYEEDTGVETSLGTQVILAGMSTNFVITGLEDGAVGSVVVRSSQPVTCAVDYSAETTGTDTNPYRFAATKGFDQNEIGPVMYLSQVEKNFWGWNSYIAIQNTSNSSVGVTVSFVDRDGVSYDDVILNIPGYANHVLYLKDISILPESQFIGGATISANDGETPLAVSTAFYNSGDSPETSQIHAWNGSANGSNLLYAPYIVMNYYEYNSGLMIQNIGSEPTAFKITFTFNGVDYIYQHETSLNQGESEDFYLPDVSVLAPVKLIQNNLRYGKAVIEATDTGGNPNPIGELIANVNQENRGPGGGTIPMEFMGNGGTYGAFLSSSSSNTFYIAKVIKHVGGFSSGFHISNFSDSDITCDLTFPEDSDASFSQLIPANSFYTRWVGDLSDLDNGYNAGVQIECNNPVFIITNASNDPDVGKYGDSFYQMSAGQAFEN
jgi:hypothetical protein